jgi:hypothetical protein
MIRPAKNGCATNITFRGIPVYHSWDYGLKISTLGKKKEKEEKEYFIKMHLTEESYLRPVQKLLIDWDLYENGWLVDKYQNKHLFYYLCQMGNYGSHRPIELTYFKYLEDK